MFAPDTFAARRAALASAVGDGLIVLLGNGDAPMNYPANLYAFRQDGSFLYATGLDVPNLALTLDAETGEATLYGPDPTLDDVIWEGPAPSLAERAASAGIPKTAAPSALDAAVAEARRQGRAVHVLPPYRGDTTLKLARMLDVAPDALAPSEVLMDALIAQRLVKTDAEVAEIERAVAVAAEAHRLAMRLAQPGRSEREIAGAIQGHYAAHGGFAAFPVLLTRRGETLHNHATDAVLESGDLLLVDTGAVVDRTRYVSDITRVSPVGGAFSDRQRAVYQAVLDAQLAALDAMRPGVPFRDVHRLAAVTLAERLTDLGWMRGDPEEAVAAGAHALFFPHGLGHALGLDVHDLEALGEDRVGYDREIRRSDQFGTAYLRFGRRLEAGHVMTVEPGCYVIGPLIDTWKAEGRHAAFLDYDEIERWRGFGGIRIEDDVLVTDDGIRVLGPEIPKTPDAVEAVVRGEDVR